MTEPEETESERSKPKKTKPKKIKTEGLGRPKEFAIYLGIVITVSVLLFYLLGDLKQTLAATVFLATILGTLMFWKFRVAIAFLGLVLLLLTKTIDTRTAIEFMDLDVILFLAGMMIIVGLLRQSGFFRWLLVKVLRITGFKPFWVLVIIMILGGVMAALVDEVTSILFTTALVLDLCDHFRINPIKCVISTVLATNIGSSWTVLGNPIGILIAFRSGLSLEDFIQFALPVGVVSLLFLIAIVLIWHIRDLPELNERFGVERAVGGLRDQAADAGVHFLNGGTIIKDKKLFMGSVTLFTLVVISLVLDHRLELWFGFDPNTLLFVTPILGAGVIMLWRRREAREYIQRDVDWWTLIFFMFLFSKAGCLQYVGLTDRIADAMLNLAGGVNSHIPIVVMLWVSGILSAIVDNVVVVAGLIPVAQTLSSGLGTLAPWWALLFGGCYGGNMTMIGSTANIVALGMLEKRTGHLITLVYWLRIGLLAAVIPMAIGTGALLIFS